MTLFRRLVLLVAALTCLPATALAAEVKTFAVAPFTVHGPEKYQYLSQGVQSMLESRMNWPGHLAPMDKAKAGSKLAKAPASEAEAKKTAAELGVDFLAYGSVTISGCVSNSVPSLTFWPSTRCASRPVVCIRPLPR